MSEDVRVQIELDKFKAESGLKDLARQLNSADQLIAKLKQSGVVWAEDFTEATSKARSDISKLGTITAKATDKMIKGNKEYAKSFDSITSKVKQVQDSLSSLGRNFLVKQDASKMPITAGLRDDDEKRRQAYMSKLQSSYLKEQSALQKHNQKLDSTRRENLAKQQAQLQARSQAREQYAAMEKASLNRQASAVGNFWQKLISNEKKFQAEYDAVKIKSLKNTARTQITDATKMSSTASLGGTKAVNALLREQAALARQAAIEQKKRSSADREAAQNQLELAAAGKRLTTVNLSQSGSANRLAASWRLAKQEFRETISIANIAQASMRAFTGVLARAGAAFVDMFKAAPALSSDMLGFRNALALVTGEQAEASKLLNTAVDIAVRLKLNIQSVTRQYSKFTNAATIAGLSVSKATKTFEDFAVAARVLNLNQERTGGMFLALEQMVSKGRVSMEELRRQLGEHIPGAMNLAAEAMGYGTDELGKFIKEVSNGRVESLELVTKLGELVRKRTIGQLGSSLSKFSAEVEAVSNSFIMLKLKIGDVMAPVLGKLLNFVRSVIDAFTEWLPVTTILGEESNKLASTLEGVTTAATTVSNTIGIVTGAETELAETSEIAVKSITSVRDSFEELNVVALGSVGLLGASGLGGALAGLKKGLNIIKAGLIAFLAPFGKLIAAAKSLAVFLGAGGVAAAAAKLIVYVRTLATGFTMLGAAMVLSNPFTAIAAAAAALVGVTWAMVDGNSELQDQLKVNNELFKEESTNIKKTSDQFEELATQMADLGKGDLAAALQAEADLAGKANKTLEAMKRQGDALEDNLGWTDKFLRSWGYTTDAVEESISAAARLEQSMQHIANYTAQMAGNSQDMKIAIEINAQEAAAVQEAKDLLASADLREIEFKIGMVGAEDLATKLNEINYEYDELILKARTEFKGPDFMAEVSRLDELRQAHLAYAMLVDGYKKGEEAKKKATAAAKALRKEYTSFGESLEKSIQAVKKQNAQIGMNQEELAKSNAQFEIAALQEKLHTLEIKANTNAMRDRVATMRSQITSLQQLHQQNAVLMAQEKAKTEAEKQRKKALEERQRLEKKGNELIYDTLSLEEQFAIRTRELMPALRAAGATNAQVTEVMQNQWAELVDNSKTGLTSIKAVTEEVAKGMQNNFSDFFFDTMNGEFNNLADSFTQMLNRMVADAAAAQLSQYLMGAGSSGSGFVGSILSTGLGSALGFGPAMPALGGATGTAIGGHIASAAGGGMSAAQFSAFGFAKGGRFTVGGTGGTDSQVVAFKASPNERVTVETPTQQRYSDGAGQQQNINVSFNVSTPNADSFNASRSQMELQLRQAVQRAGRNS